VSRNSRLPVLIRLAGLEEDRTLQQLGKTRMVVEQTETSLGKLAADFATTRAGAILTSGATMEAGVLATAAICGRGIQVRTDSLQHRLVGARAAEETARVAVVKAKLRLRALRRVSEQRDAREQLLERRAEMRRMDEIRRGLRLDGES
jgi:flagellar export protein FliJ